MKGVHKLFSVLDQLGVDPEDAMVAGGAALRLLFPWMSPTKDVDVFFTAEPSAEGTSWLVQNGIRIDHDRPDAEISGSEPACRTISNWRVGEFDLVFTSHPDFRGVLESFDLPICQIGYCVGNRLLIMTDACRRDVVEQKITTDPCTLVQQARLEKYRALLGWPQRQEDPLGF